MAECIVADLGGTFLRCGVATGPGTIENVERIRLAGDPHARGAAVWNDVIEAIGAYAQRRAAGVGASAAIAFAVPGPVFRGRILAAPTVFGGDTEVPDVAALLAARTGRQIALVNDVSAAAWYFSERISAQRFAVVTISSGIGAKLFDRRHPLRVLDDVPQAGEIGHLVVDDGPDAVECDCGGRGHLGAVSSARGFERSARRAAARDPEGFARSAAAARFGATPAALTNEAHLVPALHAGDAWSLALLHAATQPLATVLKTWCVGSGLDGIALMGGFAQALGEPYRALMAGALGRLSDRGPACAAVTVDLAGPDEDPSLAGAAAFVRLRSPVP